MNTPSFTMSLSPADLAAYVARQMAHFFPDGDESKSVRAVVNDAVARMEHCVRHVRMKGWWGADGPRFHHLHTDQYAVFLYYLANTAYRAGAYDAAAKAYALNKALHGLDAFFEVELPAIFAVQHPVGTVLGRATYGDYFFAYHNVSVGADLADRHPTFGSGVIMYGGARVIGTTHIGSNCFIGAGCSILKGTVPDDHIAFGQYPTVGTKPTPRNVVRDIFKDV